MMGTGKSDQAEHMELREQMADRSGSEEASFEEQGTSKWEYMITNIGNE